MAPQDRPQNPDGTTETALWAEDDLNVVKPDAAKQNLGYEQLEDPSSSFRNWLDRAITRLTRFFHFRHVRGDKGLMASYIQTAGVFATSANLTSSLAYSEIYLEGVLVEVQAVANWTFTPSKDTYVGVNVDGALEYQETTNGGAEPTPTAGYTHFCKVVTDVDNVTGATAELDVVPRFADVKARTLHVQRDDDGDSFSATGGGTSGVGGTFLGAGGKAGVLSTSGSTGPASRHVGLAAGQPAVEAVHLAGGPGGTFAGHGAGKGVEGTGGATGSGVKGTGGATNGYGGEFRSQSASPGTYGEGGNNASSEGGQFVATHVDATGLLGQTASAATSGANAVLGQALGDGVGVKGLAVDGYGVVAESDTSTPKRAALRVVPQDADPTTALEGDIHYNSDEDQLKGYIDSRWQGLWATEDGFTRSTPVTLGADSNNDSVTYTTLCSTALPSPYDPKKVGDVMLWASGEFGNAGATLHTGIDMRIRDTTSGVTIWAQTIDYTDSVTGPIYNRPWSIIVPYTLPATGPRNFALEFRKTGGASGVVARDANIFLLGVF